METFGKYQLLRRLGAGGMAEVFLAREPLAGGLSKTLVIKKIHPSLAETPQFRAMFEDEAKIGVLLNHPNIVQTFNYGQLGHTYFLAMERVEGVDLLKLIHAGAHAKKKLPAGLAAYIVQQVAKGLDYAHRKSDDYGEPLHIVHRDVSPQNVLVSFDGAVKIVDFGIARVRGQKNDEGVVKGKYAYMSPEQASGKAVDRRSDIFSAGIVLYEVTTALALFGRLSERQAIDAIRNAQVPRPRDADPEMPEELEQIILKCLQRRPEERFQTARDLHNALGRFFFQRGSDEKTLYESGTLAAYIAQVVPAEERGRIRSLETSPPQPMVARPRRPDGEARDRTEVVPVDTPAVQAHEVPAVSSDGLTDGSLPAFGPRERKSVVVVEGLLEGLPALRRQVGEPKARAALLDFLRIAEHVAFKHHAHCERLDERGFTYIVGLPIASEHDASTAVQLGLSLAEAMEGIARDLRPKLTLSVGCERGTALVGRSEEPGDSRFEYELTGGVERLARRLAQEAMPGEVLIGPAVQRGARRDFRLEELEPIELSFDAEPPVPADTPSTTPSARTRIYRTLGPRARAERLAGESSALLWGRELELQALDDALRDVVARGGGRWLCIVGDRGVGKRSLVEGFQKRLDPKAFRVLRTVATATRRDVPYAAITDLARDLLGVSDEADPRELKRKIESALRPLFGSDEQKRLGPCSEALAIVLGVRVAGAEEIEPAERRLKLYQALRNLGSQLAQQRSLILIVEDIHVADDQSFEIMAALARDPLLRPVLIVATARREAVAESVVMDAPTRSPGATGESEEGRIEALLAEPNVTPIYLGELEPRAREALLLSRFERPDDADVLGLARLILDRAGGNPFYIGEILESLAERGVLRAEEPSGRYTVIEKTTELTLPPSVEAVVGSRLDRLSDEDRALVRTAAVLGRTFRGSDLAAMLDRDPAERLEKLTARGLFEPASGATGAMSFRSAVTQEVAYGALAPEVRAALHRKAAERLAAAPGYTVGADDARIAQHLEAAGDPVGAGRACARAGIHARDVSGNAEAFRHFSHGLKLLPETPETAVDRWDLHAEREQILRAWGKRSQQLLEVAAMRRIAEEMGDEHRLARSLSRQGALLLDAGKHAAARRELARALETARAAGDRIIEAEALRIDATLLMNTGSYGDALDRTRAALAALAGLEDRASARERAQSLHALGNIEFDQGRGATAREAYTEALVIYRRLGTRRLESATLNNLGNVANSLGEFEAAIEHYKQSLKIDQEIGDRLGIGATLGNVGQTYAQLGDLDRARRYLGKALALDEASGDLGGLTDATIGLGQVFLRLGDAQSAAERLERGLELAQEQRNRYQEIRALIYLAFCKLQAGARDEGPLDLARSAVKLARESQIANGLCFGLTAQARALERLGRTAEAAEHSAEAVATIESGKVVDEVEEIFFTHAELSRAAGRDADAKRALERALTEVRAKAERMRDEVWRRQYLASLPAAAILKRAKEAGLS